ncbi:MAG: nucleoside hydrolase [Acidobacteriota bacterium]
MQRLLITLTLAAVNLAADKAPVILDTDIGTDIDDAFALALVLASPELELRAVTTVSADAYGRALIACRMLDEAGRAGVPVAAGRPPRPQPETKGQYLYGQQPGFSKRPVPELAPQFLYQQLRAEPGRLTIVSVGDLTNVARLLTDHPEARAWIKRIVIMGGAVRVGYNGQPPPSWEWNIRSDIKGAQVVFASGVPLTVAPLDATTTVKLAEPLRRRIFAAGTPLTGPLHALYLLWGKTTPTLFDPVAVTLSFDESFCRMEALRLEVDDQGFTREVPGQPNARVALSIRGEEFLEWYVRRLTRFSAASPPPRASSGCRRRRGRES